MSITDRPRPAGTHRRTAAEGTAVTQYDIILAKGHEAALSLARR